MSMKKVVCTEDGGLDNLLGEEVMVWSLNYIYAGTLSQLGEDVLVLSSPKVVYETGPFNGSFKDAQPLRNEAYILLRCVEMVTKV